MSKNPLAEVFGYPTTNRSPEAERHWEHKLCPFNNKVPNCTKDKATDPLGVCSLYHGASPIITCPVRFRQEWIITNDAADFFFPPGTLWTTLVEIRLDDAEGKTAGNIDVVLVSYDEQGRVTDFGSLEIQAVYISGNIRRPFEQFMANRTVPVDWQRQALYPRPDYLSSSRKRLVPQLLWKGGILNTWGKRQAVALQTSFYHTLPKMPVVDDPAIAEMAWMLYDLERDEDQDRFDLVLKERVYTMFNPALEQMIRPRAGPVDKFVSILQRSLDSKLTPPEAPTLLDITDV